MMNRVFGFLMALPILLWMLCLAVVFCLGFLFDCKINESNADTCRVFGIELGDSVYGLALFAAWGPLMFGPIVLGTGILWALVALIAAIRRRSR